MRKQYTFHPKSKDKFFFCKADFTLKVANILLDGLKDKKVVNGKIELVMSCYHWTGIGVVNRATFNMETEFVSGEVFAYFWTVSSTSGQIEKVVLKIKKTKKLKVEFT